MIDRPAEPQEINTWDEMSAWIADALPFVLPGTTLDFGPADLRVFDEPALDDIAPDEEERPAALCAQIVALSGRYLVRRSTVVLDVLRFVDHDAAIVAPNRWFSDDPYGDCTHGYLYVDDELLAAQICTAWLRDQSGEETPASFAFSQDDPVTLPGVDTGPAWPE